MAVMLGAMFLCIVLGLASPRFGPRTGLMAAAIAAAMAAIYYFSNRAM